MTAETPAGAISAARLSRIALAAVDIAHSRIVHVDQQTRLRNAIRRCAVAADAADAMAASMLASWECAFQDTIERDGTPLRELVADGEWRTRNILLRQAELCRKLAAIRARYAS